MENLVNGKQVKMGFKYIHALEGNTFLMRGFLLHPFLKNAQQQNWTEKEIELVLDECNTRDYEHRVLTIINHVTE